MWFFNKAAPIPGVSFLKKYKKHYSQKAFAYKTLDTFLCIFSKKQRTKVFRQRKKSTMGTGRKKWKSVVFIESLFQENLCKTSLIKNPKERARVGTLCFVNGKSRKESTFLEHGQGALHKPADFIQFSPALYKKNSMQ